MILFRRIPQHILKAGLTLATDCDIDPAVVNQVAEELAGKPDLVAAIISVFHPEAGLVAVVAESIIDMFKPELQSIVEDILATCNMDNVKDTLRVSELDAKTAREFVENY